MPNHDIHRLIEKMIFGKSFKEIDHAIDAPAWMPVWHQDKNGKWVYTPLGPNHRVMNHTPTEAALIGLLKDPQKPWLGFKSGPEAQEGMMAGLMHIALDNVFDGLHSYANSQKKKRTRRKRN